MRRRRDSTTRHLQPARSRCDPADFNSGRCVPHPEPAGAVVGLKAVLCAAADQTNTYHTHVSRIGLRCYLSFESLLGAEYELCLDKCTTDRAAWSASVHLEVEGGLGSAKVIIVILRRSPAWLSASHELLQFWLDLVERTGQRRLWYPNHDCN